MTIPTISTLPTAPARTDPPATFVTRADSFLAALVVMQGELNTSIGAMNTDIAGVNADATAASDSAAAAAASATAAANAAGADLWVSGQAYAQGDAAISLVNYQTYRAETATSGTTDPSLDANWTAISGTFPDQTGNAGKYLTTDGTNPSWAASDATIGTLTKTFVESESSTINLSSSVLAPVVSVTKEVAQSEVTNNSWDVNSSDENYAIFNSAYDTALGWEDYDISGATLTQRFIAYSDIVSPTGITFSPDGTKMFLIGTFRDDVVQYNLSTAFDISTATKTGFKDFAVQDGSIEGVVFNNDGTKMFLVGTTNDSVYEYSLSTAFLVTSASYVQSFSVAAQDGFPTDITFNDDGLKMFVVGGSSDSIYQYELLTAFDISTASFTAVFSVAGQEPAPEGMAFSADGTNMFVVGTGVHKYSLSTAFDITTSVHTKSNSAVTGFSIAFNSDGTKLFTIDGNSTTAGASEYALNFSTLLLESGSFASSDVGKTIEINDGKLILTNTDGAYSEITAPTSYAQAASGTWGMFAIVYNSIGQDLELSGIVNTYDIANQTTVGSFTLTTQDTDSQSTRFNTDGTKMFVLGGTGVSVYEYTLSSPFLVSSASFVDSFSVANEETAPKDFYFSNDGKKMFVVGFTADLVFQYDLSTAFDISTSVYNQSYQPFSANPLSICFNNDGTKMYVGMSGAGIEQHSLSTAFDISTAKYDGVLASFTSPIGIAFNYRGSKFYYYDGARIREFDVPELFNILSARNTGLFVNSLANRGMTFSPDGGSVYFTFGDGTNSSVTQRSVGTAATFPTGYHAAHTKISTDSTYWTDINSMTANQNAGDGNIYYAISTDDRTTWTVIDNTDGERDIVRNNAGTWQYNSNSTYASETWTDATTNSELAALQESMSTGQNRMDKAQLEAVTDPNHIALGDDLDLAIVFNMVSGEGVPSSNGVSINYDATVLNKSAILGTDYEFDAPTSSTARITALTSGNFKVRVV